MKQMSFQQINWRHRYSYGGNLRQKRAGRVTRPLSGRDPIHLVLKADREVIRTGFRSYRRFFLIQTLVQRYAAKFFVKIEQISVQGDHIHLLIRSSRRSNFQSFFRVLAGQIAQEFQKQGLVTDTPKPTSNSMGTKVRLWKYRPFSRVVKAWRDYKNVRNYIQLNEKEALGEIAYSKRRLKGLSMQDWQTLWN